MGQVVWDASQRREHQLAHRYFHQAATAARQCGDVVAAAHLVMATDLIGATWGGGGLNLVFTAVRELRRCSDLPVVRDAWDRVMDVVAQ